MKIRYFPGLLWHTLKNRDFPWLAIVNFNKMTCHMSRDSDPTPIRAQFCCRNSNFRDFIGLRLQWLYLPYYQFVQSVLSIRSMARGPVQRGRKNTIFGGALRENVRPAVPYYYYDFLIVKPFATQLWTAFRPRPQPPSRRGFTRAKLKSIKCSLEYTSSY